MLVKKIEEWRLKRGFLKKELAKRAGINPVHLSMILTGKKKNLQMDTVQRLAKALSVPISELQGDLPEPEKPEPLNKHTEAAQHFFRATHIPEEDKQTILKFIELYEERAKRAREKGGKDGEEDSSPDI